MRGKEQGMRNEALRSYALCCPVARVVRARAAIKGLTRERERASVSRDRVVQVCQDELTTEVRNPGQLKETLHIAGDPLPPSGSSCDCMNPLPESGPDSGK